MKHARKTALAASAFTCAALLSFGWSEQGGISLSIESAQARVGRPLTLSALQALRVDRTGAPRIALAGKIPSPTGARGRTSAAPPLRAPRRSARLPRSARLALSRPPHLGDGEAAPTKQAQVTTQVVLTTAVQRGAL